jgi:Spy/CpxP family protein refolding chaperone
MKMNFKKRMALPTLMAAMIGSAGIALAQPPPGNGPQNPPPNQNFRRPPGQPGQQGQFGGLAQLAPGLAQMVNELTDEQRQSLRAAMQSQREKMRDIEMKVRDARKEMFEAAVSGKFDEAVVRTKAEGVAKLEAERSVLMAKALSQMTPPLTPEQIEKIKNAQPPQGGPGPNPQRQAIRERRQLDRAPNRDENDLPMAPKPQN